MSITISDVEVRGDVKQRVYLTFSVQLSNPKRLAFERRLTSKFGDALNKLIWHNNNQRLEIEIKRTAIMDVHAKKIVPHAADILKRIDV